MENPRFWRNRKHLLNPLFNGNGFRQPPPVVNREIITLDLRNNNATEVLIPVEQRGVVVYQAEESKIAAS